jgi:hypothetical protein
VKFRQAFNLGTLFGKAVRTRRGAAAIAVGLAVIGLALSAVGSGASASVGTVVPGQAVPQRAISHLDAIAASFVRENGGHQPLWESAVVTTHARALTSATPGDTEPDSTHTVVYLITMKGHFIGYGASVPPGAKLPTGTYLSVVVDAKTYGILDWGLSPGAPPVAPARLGKVTMLLR